MNPGAGAMTQELLPAGSARPGLLVIDHEFVREFVWSIDFRGQGYRMVSVYKEELTVDEYIEADYDQEDPDYDGEPEEEEMQMECPYCDDGWTSGIEGMRTECGECGGTGWY